MCTPGARTWSRSRSRHKLCCLLRSAASSRAKASRSCACAVSAPAPSTAGYRTEANELTSVIIGKIIEKNIKSLEEYTMLERPTAAQP
jgi:hypothetical protein